MKMHLLCRVIALAVVLIASGVSCFAADLSVIQANREIGGGFSASWISYHEYQNGGVLDSERGWVPGVTFKASAIGDKWGIQRLLGRFTYDLHEGRSFHVGQVLNGTGTKWYDAPFTSNDIAGEVGKGFVIRSNLLLTAGAELEYRRWHRELPQALLAIDEKYTFFAPGISVRGSYAPGANFVLNGKLGLGYTVSPSDATVGRASGGVPNVTFSLGTRPVWRAEIGADRAINPSIHVFVAGVYSRFGFGQSGTAHFGMNGTELEPRSVTDLVRLSAGLAWSF